MEKVKRPRIPKKQAPQIGEIEWMLKAMGLTYEKEYKFSPDRKYKADLAIPSLKVLIEYEGLFSAKSRHTTATGYTTDTEKYWIANCLGWKVLRVTAINYKGLPEFLRMLEITAPSSIARANALNIKPKRLDVHIDKPNKADKIPATKKD